VIDAVDEVLAERQDLDVGYWRGSGLSIALHAGIAAVMLVEFAHQRDAVIPLPSTTSRPPGEIVGVPFLDQSISTGKATTVLKPPSALSSRHIEVPASSTRRQLTPPAVADRTSSGGDGSTGVVPLVLGDPDAPTSPYSWYLAGVQAKVWSVWASQGRPQFTRPVDVQFTILEDGSVADTKVVAASESVLVDLAAMRAIVSAEPFAKLPRGIEPRRLTIRARFTPEP
jgi:TonB family protein